MAIHLLIVVYTISWISKVYIQSFEKEEEEEKKTDTFWRSRIVTIFKRKNPTEQIMGNICKKEKHHVIVPQALSKQRKMDQMIPSESPSTPPEQKPNNLRNKPRGFTPPPNSSFQKFGSPPVKPSPDTINWNEVIEEIMGPNHDVDISDEIEKTSTGNMEDEDEFDFEPEQSPMMVESTSVSKVTPVKKDAEIVTVTITSDISKIDKDNVQLPLPMASNYQTRVKVHSFNPQPIFYDIKDQPDGSSVLNCKYSSSSTQVSYIVDLHFHRGIKSRKHRPLGIGKKTCIDFVNCNHPTFQDIIKQQDWNNVNNVQERARLIAEWVGTLPYHVPNLYDQIHNYIDYQKGSREGFKALFAMFCHACKITHGIEADAFENVIFENIKDVLFFKICYPSTVQIEILNKTQDNDYYRVYL